MNSNNYLLFDKTLKNDLNAVMWYWYSFKEYNLWGTTYSASEERL